MAEDQKKTYSLYGTKDGDKDKGYHKFWGKHIMDSYLTWRHYVRHKMSESYRFFNGEQGNTEYDSLYSAFDLPTGRKGPGGKEQKMTLPYVYVNFNKIRNRVKTQLGELASLGFEAEAKAINAEARTERTKMKMKVMTQMALQPYYNELAAVSGINYGVDNELPETLEELEEFFRYSYKQNSEIVLEACLRYTLEYYSYLTMRLDLFLDAIVAGECHAASEVVNHFPRLRKCNPLNVGYYSDMDDDDYLTKTHLFFEFFYLDVNQVMAKYKLTKEQIDDLREKGGADGSKLYQGVFINNDIGNVFTPFDESGKRILIFKARWMDTRKCLHVEKTDADGEVTTMVLYGEDAEKTYKLDAAKTKEKGITVKFVRKEIGWTRHVTLIGGEIVPDGEYGACEYMLRDPAKPEEAFHEYVSFKPFTVQGRNMSEVDVVKPLQQMLGYIITKIQLEITKSGGAAIAIDVSKLPKEFGSDPRRAIKEVLYHLKASGLIFYNGAQGDTLPNGAMPINRFDTGLGASIAQLINVYHLLDSQMEDVGSVSRQMRGEQVSANQLKGVLQMNLQQSQKVNKPLYDKFFGFESRLLTKHAQHIRMTFQKHPEMWKHVIGDVYYLFLNETEKPDFTRDYHKIFIKAQPVTPEKLQQYLMASVEQGALKAHEALEIELMAEESIKEAIRMYMKRARRFEKQQAEQQQMMMQQQMMAQQQAQQAEVQGDMMRQQAKTEGERMIVADRAASEEKKTAMKEMTKRQALESQERRQMMEDLKDEYAM